MGVLLHAAVCERPAECFEQTCQCANRDLLTLLLPSFLSFPTLLSLGRLSLSVSHHRLSTTLAWIRHSQKSQPCGQHEAVNVAPPNSAPHFSGLYPNIEFGLDSHLIFANPCSSTNNSTTKLWSRLCLPVLLHFRDEIPSKTNEVQNLTGQQLN